MNLMWVHIIIGCIKMKVAIIGSRNLTITNLEKYIPENTLEIVSGGAKGIDRCAKEFSKAHNIHYTEFRPDYIKYQRYAPLKRNLDIINYSDYVIAFWDGLSRGTKFVIDNCIALNKPIQVYII